MKTRLPTARFRRNLWIAAVGVALFTIVGFFVVPPVLKSQLEKRLSAELGRAVTVGKVHFNPYALSLTLEDFDIRLKEGNGSFVGWKRLYVNFDALSSLTGDWVLSEIDLDGFHLGFIIKPDGTLNFSDLLARLNAEFPPPAAGAPPAKPGRPLRIGSLKVNQARVEFADQSRTKPFATILGPVTFSATEFRTVGGKGAPSHFEAISEAGEKFAWTGTISAEPFRSVGEFSMENINLAKYAPYYVTRMQADLVEGRLSVRGGYEVNLTEGQRAVKFRDGVVQLRGLKILERESQAVAVELAALDITGMNSDALTQKGTVGMVVLSGGHIRARREKDETINLVTMFTPPPEAVTAAPGLAPQLAAVARARVATAVKMPEFMIGEIGLKDFQVEVTDLAAPRPAELGLSAIQCSLKNVTLADGAVMPLQLSMAWAPEGKVNVEGTLSVKPEVKAELKTDVTGLALLPLSPYLEKFINARLTQGAVTVGLAIQVAMPEGQALAATASGDVTVEKFGLVDGIHDEELAGVGALQLKGIKVSTAPQLSVSLDEVQMTGPYARILVNSDKTLNLSSLAKTTASLPAETPAPANPVSVGDAPVAATNAPKISVGRVVISEGDFSFADRSVEPNVRMALNQFAGTITGLSSENLAKAGVDLKATVDGAGPVSITGKLDPLGPTKYVDLKIDFHNVDLLPLSPYSGKYAGYELARGKLLLDVKVLLEGKQIDATNVITLNQFTFGPPVKSADATSLPVRLGVALLKDMDGKIVIDVPVQGNIDDPNVRFGKAVLRVVGNLFTKAAVSPFSLLGSMFGGGGDELGYQEFAPGVATLQPSETKKLETMVKALTNRPGLSVDLEGSYDGPADTFALKQQKFAALVRRAVWEQKHATTPTIPPPEELVITAEENEAMVRQLFDAKFPPGTQFGAPVATAPAAAARPPEPKKGFLDLVVEVITFRSMRSDKPKTEGAAKAAEVKVAGVTVVTGPALEEMTGRMAETMLVDENDLHALADERARKVRDYFIVVGKIDPERLFLAKDKADATKASKGPRVFLNLQ